MLIKWENIGTKLLQILRQENVLSSVIVTGFHCIFSEHSWTADMGLSFSLQTGEGYHLTIRNQHVTKHYTSL